MQTARPSNIVRFSGFELDLRAGELRKGEQTMTLQEQPFQILTMLLAHPGEVVTREEVRKKLWPNDTIVEFDHSINAAMQRLRLALGDSADRKSTRLNSSHGYISYAVFCLKKKKNM